MVTIFVNKKLVNQCELALLNRFEQINLSFFTNYINK